MVARSVLFYALVDLAGRRHALSRQRQPPVIKPASAAASAFFRADWFFPFRAHLFHHLANRWTGGPGRPPASLGPLRQFACCHTHTIPLSVVPIFRQPVPWGIRGKAREAAHEAARVVTPARRPSSDGPHPIRAKRARTEPSPPMRSAMREANHTVPGGPCPRTPSAFLDPFQSLIFCHRHIILLPSKERNTEGLAARTPAL